MHEITTHPTIRRWVTRSSLTSVSYSSTGFAKIQLISAYFNLDIWVTYVNVLILFNVAACVILYIVILQPDPTIQTNGRQMARLAVQDLIRYSCTLCALFCLNASSPPSLENYYVIKQTSRHAPG